MVDLHISQGLQDRKAVVAMSGGVDSSTCALILRQNGWKIVGVSLQVWDYSKSCKVGALKTCCSPRDFQDARLVATKLGIPFYVFDVEDEFEARVISKFKNYYQNGLTPSPCIDCNVFVKFGELLNKATALGYPRVATGHYARILSRKGDLFLARAVDRDKDQSYFLYGLGRRTLSSALFPLGCLTKSYVRQIAENHGLVTAKKKDSQDLCFIGSSVSDFLSSNSTPVSGVIRHISGRALGIAENVFSFTVGQRKGLKVSWSKPLFVLKISPETREVIVGEREYLKVKTFFVTDWVWYEDFETTTGFIQVRNRHSGASCLAQKVDSKTVRITLLDDAIHIITPGQAGVLYDENDEIILGGGEIRQIS
ncbi:MAG: tRNA 2-thiouridine(34) synthase MnmA [Deltaproteobacteria bacterium]|nr:tRNA 2-thiouridine(34) synthase MnmA [Deltaproteobacteria bacterium]